jgi:DNA-binding IclR family transcriptional regulator
VSQRVQSVERALWLLETIAAAEEPPTVPELAGIAGVNRATTWRLLNTLVHFGLVARVDDSGRYVVGAGTLRLTSQRSMQSLVRTARPHLEHLAGTTGATAYLEVATRGRIVVLDDCRPDGPVQIDLSRLEVPLHCGSVGKLHLATWSAVELESYLAGTLEKPTNRTITTPEELREEIRAAEAAGVAYNYGEHREEWCGLTAVARDTHGRHLCYLNLTLPTWTTTEEALHNLTPALLNAVRAVELRLAPPPALVAADNAPASRRWAPTT